MKAKIDQFVHQLCMCFLLMLYLLKAKIAKYETEAVRWFMPKIQINLEVCTECPLHLTQMYFKFTAFLLTEILVINTACIFHSATAVTAEGTSIN